MSLRLDATAVIVPAPDVVVRDIAGQHLLVPVRSGIAGIDCLFTADEVGSFLYARLDGRRDAAALAADISAEFDVTADQALADVIIFLEELCEAGLARPREEM
jgi:coenzyme PQQ synthesis protein D (PqqD)